MQHKFEGFILEVVKESPDTPMGITIEGNAALTVELPKAGAFHHYPLDDKSEMNVVMFKMDNSTKTPPEISFQLTDVELEELKRVSVLPVLG